LWDESGPRASSPRVDGPPQRLAEKATQAWYSRPSPTTQSGQAGLAARRERTSTVVACDALALARSPAVAQPAQGSSADELSMMGQRERRGAKFQGGVLTEVTARRWGGGRWPVRQRSTVVRWPSAMP
jgi:hypothetical protein